MKKMLSVKGKDYSLVTKVGLEDDEGKVIIPREYDRIEKINDDLFAAIEENTSCYIHLGLCTTICKGSISYSTLLYIWSQRLSKSDVSVINIDFYSHKGKMKVPKRVIAYYYSEKNDLFVVLDENFKWNIWSTYVPTNMFYTYANYDNLDAIREIHKGRLLVSRNRAYEVFVRQPGHLQCIEPFTCKDILAYSEKGLVLVNDDNKRAFIDYSGKLILDYVWDDIIPNQCCIKVTNNDNMSEGIYSYDGEEIIPCVYSSIVIHHLSDTILYVAYNEENDDTKIYKVFAADGKLLKENCSRINLINSGHMIYCSNGKYGLVKYDKRSNNFIEIMPNRYSHIGFVTVNGVRYIRVRKAGMYAIFTCDGKMFRNYKFKFLVPEIEQYWYLTN